MNRIKHLQFEHRLSNILAEQVILGAKAFISPPSLLSSPLLLTSSEAQTTRRPGRPRRRQLPNSKFRSWVHCFPEAFSNMDLAGPVSNGALEAGGSGGAASA